MLPTDVTPGQWLAAAIAKPHQIWKFNYTGSHTPINQIISILETIKWQRVVIFYDGKRHWLNIYNKLVEYIKSLPPHHSSFLNKRFPNIEYDAKSGTITWKYTSTKQWPERDFKITFIHATDVGIRGLTADLIITYSGVRSMHIMPMLSVEGVTLFQGSCHDAIDACRCHPLYNLIQGPFPGRILVSSIEPLLSMMPPPQQEIPLAPVTTVTKRGRLSPVPVQLLLNLPVTDVVILCILQFLDARSISTLWVPGRSSNVWMNRHSQTIWKHRLDSDLGDMARIFGLAPMANSDGCDYRETYRVMRYIIPATGVPVHEYHTTDYDISHWMSNERHSHAIPVDRGPTLTALNCMNPLQHKEMIIFHGSLEYVTLAKLFHDEIATIDRSVVLTAATIYANVAYTPRTHAYIDLNPTKFGTHSSGDLFSHLANKLRLTLKWGWMDTIGHQFDDYKTRIARHVDITGNITWYLTRTAIIDDKVLQSLMTKIKMCRLCLKLNPKI